MQVASRSVRVASRSHRGLPRGLMCGPHRGPREQTLRPKFLILVPSRPSVDFFFKIPLSLAPEDYSVGSRPQRSESTSNHLLISMCCFREIKCLAF